MTQIIAASPHPAYLTAEEQDGLVTSVFIPAFVLMFAGICFMEGGAWSKMSKTLNAGNRGWWPATSEYQYVIHLFTLFIYPLTFGLGRWFYWKRNVFESTNVNSIDHFYETNGWLWPVAIVLLILANATACAPGATRGSGGWLIVSFVFSTLHAISVLVLFVIYILTSTHFTPDDKSGEAIGAISLMGFAFVWYFIFEWIRHLCVMYHSSFLAQNTPSSSSGKAGYEALDEVADDSFPRGNNMRPRQTYGYGSGSEAGHPAYS